MKYYSLSDIGLKRQKNQDSYCCLKNEAGDYLFLVCDGIGGGKAGEVASAEVIKHFMNAFSKLKKLEKEKQAINFLEQTITSSNKEIYSLSKKYKEFRGMGTTLTGVLFSNAGTYTINIGDSRVYGYQDKELKALTKDHSLVNDLLDKGEISLEEAANHPQKHYLIKAVGIWPNVIADINRIEDYEQFIICSDGLYGYVKEEEMIAVLENDSLSIEDRANNLVKKALMQGGYDNITVIVIDVL